MSLWNEVVWHARQLLPLSYVYRNLRWRMWMGRCFDLEEIHGELGQHTPGG